ncbi:hypothetical protein CKM354_000838800 [Cercospora kikuchii]|uniref:DUF788 domain protein n=1 Tax=Cercospora kikuchii TaxID=84275 RepID=A0A9P3CVS3_9PEZI|nr:uncharacterized protein CKM354_000838800 [Cercospora kikuchii]GIZ45208.1 hypothetical protein CKM354_000838800 [Cercospora kikuchii]
MAKKALKTQAQSNAATLNRTHQISLGINALYLVLSLLVFRRRNLFLYFLFNAPALIIEFWFERIARPTYVDGELKRAGEDLDAKGLTEFMWDVLYWTWGTVALVSLVGDYGWWVYAVVPLYSIWSAWTTYSGFKTGMGGMMPGGATEPAATQGGQSKRQAKLEKRGGQKVQYR